jgi:hypothetical protein
MEGTMSERFEVLDAFVDGELVDPDDVKRALSEPDGRDYMVDAWLLRNAVQDEMSTDTAAPVIVRTTAPARHSWAIAAAVAGISLIGGYLVGTRLPNIFGPARTDPPAATVVAPPPVPVPAPAATSFPLPSPTRVILLEFQSNASSGVGG